jgi:glutathione synthase/RimK-type ligase-like ATP-grasp enzyme
MTILVCTASTVNDPGIDMVIRAIETRGASAFRLETDLFPTDLQLTIGWDKKDRLLLSSSEEEIDLSKVSSVWIRHMDTGDKLPDDLDHGHREGARLESDSMIWGLLECLNIFQLDPPESLRRAPYKPRQLQLARELGLEIPRTLITNNPQEVRDFAKTCRHGLIAKMIDGSSVSVETDQGSSPVYTRHLSAEDFTDLDSLNLCPMIFQELVPKALELRITIVGTRVFVAAVDSAVSTIGADDWRKDKGLVREFRPFDHCPEEILERFLVMLDRLGLNFATIDMIVTPDGRYVFLELNTISYFDFVERATGLPISGAIADLLLGLTPSRISQRGVSNK